MIRQWTVSFIWEMGRLKSPHYINWLHTDYGHDIFKWTFSLFAAVQILYVATFTWIEILFHTNYYIGLVYDDDMNIKMANGILKRLKVWASNGPQPFSNLAIFKFDYFCILTNQFLEVEKKTSISKDFPTKKRFNN